MVAVIFSILNNYHPLQKMRSVVIGVYKFGQEFLIIGILLNFLYKYFIKIPVEAA